MRNIMIITDSGADLPEELMLENIKVIPFNFYFKGEESKIYQDNSLYSSSQVQSFLNLGVKGVVQTMDIDTIIDEIDKDARIYPDIICIHSSENQFPGIKENFYNAIKEVSNGNLIAVFDSGTTSMALGLLVHKVAKMALEGKDFWDLTEYVNYNSKYYQLDFILPEVKYLLESGAKSKLVTKFISKSDALKPVMSINEEGLIAPVSIRKSSYNQQVDLLKRLVKNNVGNDISIIHSASDNEVNRIKDEIAESISDVNITISEMNKTNTIRLGPGVIGLAYKRK